MTNPSFNAEALKSEIRQALINQKVNACPMAVRIAWHSSGTYDARDNSGGSNGATMRFEPEDSDPANAGLSIIRDLLRQVKMAHPEVSLADLWTLAGAAAVEFLGGPKVPFTFGRSDAPNGSTCPANGRLPDASQGAQHLRDVFHRMGMSDREIVALSGAHTLGRCHLVRSGFDGKWTNSPLKFDNEYFKNLLTRTWRPRKWDGNLQYEDAESGELMMLPTDIALIEDPGFRQYVQMYANSQETFFADFAQAFSKLLSLGVPSSCPVATGGAAREEAGAHFREAAMHGHTEEVKKLAKVCDVHALEKSSGRTALHKAAFWGHDHLVAFLVNDCRLDPNVTDYKGDTALHDAASFGHAKVVEVLLPVTDVNIKNKDGHDVLAMARLGMQHGGGNVAAKQKLIQTLEAKKGGCPMGFKSKL